jgi:hypothetical protein
VAVSGPLCALAANRAVTSAIDEAVFATMDFDSPAFRREVDRAGRGCGGIVVDENIDLHSAEQSAPRVLRWQSSRMDLTLGSALFRVAPAKRRSVYGPSEEANQ